MYNLTNLSTKQLTHSLIVMLIILLAFSASLQAQEMSAEQIIAKANLASYYAGRR